MPPIQPPGGPPTGTDFSNLVAAQIGTPYVWGGDRPGGFDCSGLVYWAAQQLGIANFPRTSEEQWGAVQRIRADQLQPGDLIFMNFPGEASPGHVVIYAGGDQIIQAPSTGQLVQRDSFTSGTAQQWGAVIVGYGRIPGLNYSGEPVTRNLGSGGTTSGGAGGPAGGVSPLGAFPSAISGLLGLPFPWIGSITSDIANAVLAAAAPLVKIAEALDWFMHPAHWIRLFAGLTGGILVLFGIWQMSHAGEGSM
jgi:NlpC/P60 family